MRTDAITTRRAAPPIAALLVLAAALALVPPAAAYVYSSNPGVCRYGREALASYAKRAPPAHAPSASERATIGGAALCARAGRAAGSGVGP